MDNDQIKQIIKGYEGLRLTPYLDTTGHLTIGWGRNLNQGINIDEAELMFNNDFEQTVNELKSYSWYTMQPPGVQGCLIDMNFNLGITKLLSFTEMIKALEAKNYAKAADEILSSLWARQLPKRASDVAMAVRKGI